MNLYQDILNSRKNNQKLLAVLIDPEKLELKDVQGFIKMVNTSGATHIFVGGSTDKEENIESIVEEISNFTTLPIILFPGDAAQVTDKADGILYLSLISGRNPEYLIEQHVNSAYDIHQSNLEVIPTGYILINGGSETTVQKVSQTQALDQNNSELILKTALAGQFLGKKLIYLEAGSGAKFPVNPAIISQITEHLDIPIIVGGGIRTIEQLTSAYNSGATMAVIGTAFEKDLSFFNELKKNTTHEHIG